MNDSDLDSGPFFFDDMALKGKSGEARGPHTEPELPYRHCDICGGDERHPELARYGLAVPRSLDPKIFTTYHVLSMDDFEAMLRSFPVDDVVRETLLPGTRIGNPTFTLLTKPYDVISKGITMFVSEKALDCARTRGIQLEAVPVTVVASQRNIPIPDYYYILPRISSLMDTDWMGLEKEQCWRCQNWWLKPGLGFPKVVRMSKARAAKSKWPENAGVVYSRDIAATFYSPQFVSACLEAKLTGVAFGQVSWV